jgi:hypothetical protein
MVGGLFKVSGRSFRMVRCHEGHGEAASWEGQEVGEAAQGSSRALLQKQGLRRDHGRHRDVEQRP